MDFEKVKAAGIEFAYRWDGNPDGPVVMMAHAMGTSHRIWDWQVPALEDRYRLLRYDWRGTAIAVRRPARIRCRNSSRMRLR